MSLKTVKGTTRNDFDAELVLKHLEDDDLSNEDKTRILEEACQRIHVLEHNWRTIISATKALADITV